MARELKLRSGRVLHAYDGVVGLNPDEPSELFGGYDQHEPGADPGDEALTAEERRELAERMVAAWRKWGELD